MIRARGGDNIALAGDLTGEAGHWAGDLVDLAEEQDTGKAAVWALASDSRRGTYERETHAYALGYWGIVGWKTKILMELSTPLTVVVTSAWDSLMSMVVAVGIS